MSAWTLRRLSAVMMIATLLVLQAGLPSTARPAAAAPAILLIPDSGPAGSVVLVEG
jgi:hypothetical protein